MALLITEAAKLELPFLVSGVAEQIVTVDEVFNVIPFKNIAPVVTHEYNRENSLGSQDASFIAPEGVVTESAATFTQVSDTVKVIVAAVNVPKLYLSNPTQAATQIAKKSKQVARYFSQAFITGSGTGNAFTGVLKLVSGSAGLDIPAGGTLGSNTLSGSLSFNLMDQAFDAVTIARPTAIFANKTTLQSYYTLLRNAGGIQPQMVQVPAINSPYQTVGFRGVPVFRNDWIVANEQSNTNTGRMYFAYFDENEGLTAFFNGNTILDISDPIPVPSSDSVQFVVAMRCGLSLQSTLALSCISGLSN